MSAWNRAKGFTESCPSSNPLPCKQTHIYTKRCGTSYRSVTSLYCLPHSFSHMLWPFLNNWKPHAYFLPHIFLHHVFYTWWNGNSERWMWVAELCYLQGHMNLIPELEGGDTVWLPVSPASSIWKILSLWCRLGDFGSIRKFQVDSVDLYTSSFLLFSFDQLWVCLLQLGRKRDRKGGMKNKWRKRLDSPELAFFCRYAKWNDLIVIQGGIKCDIIDCNVKCLFGKFRWW